MADEVVVSLDAKAVTDAAAKAAKQVLDIANAGGKAEKAVETLTAQLKGLSGPQLLRQLQVVSRALGGAFSEPTIKMQALRGELAKFRGEAINMAAEVGNAQASAFRKISTAIRESQIAIFQKSSNAGFQSDTNPASLRLRIEAEKRAIESAQLASRQQTGQRVDFEKIRPNVQRFDEMTAQLAALEAARKAGAVAQAGLQNNAIKQLASISDLESQRFRIQQASLELQKAIGASGGRQTADVLDRVAALQREKQALESIKATQREAAKAAPRTAEQIAQRGNEITRARLNTNEGADFFKLQTQILANYQLVNVALSTIRNGVQFVVGFEAALKQLQAITAATGTELAGLSKRFLEVANTSRFSATEITQAAVILGQAGLSPAQIKESIDGVVKLATATGTDLKVAVDLSTSAMGIFNLRASEMSNVADMVSAALNTSKLDAEKLALGLQFVGNIAETSGTSFTELTTALAAMANAGIKSGSTLGTGLRQLLNDLISPTDKLKQAFSALGLSAADVDVRSQGLFGVLKNLQAAGFTTADALKSMELRGASALAALYNQLGNIDEMQSVITNTGDAAKAAATQMDSVEASIKRFGNVAGGLAVTAAAPLVAAFKAIINPLSDLLGHLSEFQVGLQLVALTITGITIAALTRWLVPLVGALTGITALTRGVGAMTTALVIGTGATNAFSAALGGVGKGNLTFLALSIAITAATAALAFFGTKNEEVGAKLDKVNTELNDSKGRFDNYKTTAQAVATEIDKLALKNARLSSNSDELRSVISDLNNRFRDMGFFVSTATTSVDGLIAKLSELREEQIRSQQRELVISRNLLTEKLDIQKQEVSKFFGNQGVKRFVNQNNLGKSGFRVDEFDPGPSDPTGKSIEKLAQPAGGSPLEAKANAIVGRVLEALRSRSNPQTEGEIEGTLEELSGFAKEIQDFRVEVDRNTTGNLQGVKDTLARAASGLAEVDKTVREQKALGAQININDRTQAAVESLSTVVGKQLEEFRISILNSISEAESQFLQSKVNGRVTVAGKREHDQRLTDILLTVQAQHAEIVRTTDKNTLKNLEGSGLLDQLRRVEGDLRVKVENSNLDINSEDKQILEQAKKRLGAQVQLLAARVNTKTPIGEIEGLVGQINGLFDQIDTVERNLRAIAQKDVKFRGLTDTEIETDQEISERLAAARQKEIEKLNQFVAEFNRSLAESNDKLERTPAAIKELIGNFTKIINNFTRAADASKDMVQQQENLISGMRSRVNNNLNRFSETQIRDEEQQLDFVRFQAKQAQLENLNSTIPNLQTSSANGKRLLGQYQARIGEINDQFGDPSQVAQLSDVKKNELATERATLTQREIALQQELLKIDEKRTSLLQERDQLQRQINTERNPTGELDIGDGFIKSFDQYMEATGRTKSVNVQVIDSFKDMFSSVDQGMAGFLGNVVTRTQKVSDAFAGMVKGILAAMVQIAANKLAGGILGGLMDAFTPAAAGTNVPPPVVPVGGNPIAMSAGGYIRAAQGQYVRRSAGGVPGRDSVRALVMPGEFITRKTAVDAVGVDFMERLNSMGSRALDTPVPVMTGEKRPGDVVNVWVVREDQVPPPSPKDIITTIAKDLQQGGVTKQLVKQIQMGSAS